MADETLLPVRTVPEAQVLRLVPAQAEAPVVQTPRVLRLLPTQATPEQDDELARLRAEVLYLRSELTLLKAEQIAQ